MLERTTSRHHHQRRPTSPIFGEGYFAGIPVPIAWTMVATVVGILLLHYSVYGRQI